MSNGTEANDPSAPDYGGTSPASPGRNMRCDETSSLPQRSWEGEFDA